MNNTNFSLNKSLEILHRTPSVLKSLFYSLNGEWTAVNEGPETWSAYDIVGHLIHGENTDWIPRAKIILGDDADKTFEPFDRFAQKQLSKGKSMNYLIDEFTSLRKSNLEELRSWNLSPEDLSRKGRHPELGEVTLAQLLATWTVHDLAHLNQASRVMVRHYADSVGPWRQYMALLRNY